MKKSAKQLSTFFVILLFVSGCINMDVEKTKDPLPSWNNNDIKKSIVSFVEGVTNKKSEAYVPREDRIAVFDNDGTLWSEQPLYFQLFFTIDRIKEMAPEHPEWKELQPYKAILEGDMESLADQGEHALVKLVLTSHTGMNTQEFREEVEEWIATTKHPTKNVRFDKLVYQPMLELLDYLRVNDFKTYIVSGGGVDFMRAIVQDVYGIPSEQIIGSTIKTEFELTDNGPEIMRLPELDFIDDKEGKPVAIQRIIGKKPIFCAGNSDGDLAMMQWTASNHDAGYMLYVHHTDSVREWAYDSTSHIGRFKYGWHEALENDWTIVSMKDDWKVIYPMEKK